MVGKRRIIGQNACPSAHRFSGVFVVNTKATPMVVSGVIAILIIAVVFPLRPITIVLGAENVDLVGDCGAFLRSGNMPPEALASFAFLFRKLGKFDNDVRPVLLDKILVLLSVFIVLDGIDLDNGHTDPFRLYLFMQG